MTHQEFIECWEAACTHRYASFDHKTCGAHLFGSWWTVRVGTMTLTLFHAPYIEGRHERSQIKAQCDISGKFIVDRMTNEDSLRCIELWERVQHKDAGLDQNRVMEYLRQ